MSESKEIPNGWAWATIPEMIPSGSVFVDGDWIETKDQDPNGEVRLIQLADLGDGDFKNRSSRFLTLERAKELNCTFLSQNDILVARMPDPIGRACLFPLKNGNSFVTAVDVAIIRLGDKGVDPKYLVHSINSLYIRHKIESLQSGTTRKRISRSNIAIIKFPVPPVPEQHRIVGKIEELFSSLDKGIESLKTAQQQLKVYRQAVLKWAFEGKLTNAENELRHVKFGDFIEVVSGNTPKGLESISNKGSFQFYKVSDMNLDGNEVEMKTSKLVLTKDEIVKLKIKLYPKGTVIFPKRGGAILTNKKRILSKDSSFDLNLMGALPNEKVNEKYLFYWFQKLDLCNIYDGSNVPQINNKNIEPLEFQLCSINEQQVIVAEIESRLSVCDKIEESIEQSLRQAESLRQSILKKAFEGKLVPQNPNDEPASKLLERIKAEKEKAAIKKRGLKSL